MNEERTPEQLGPELPESPLPCENGAARLLKLLTGINLGDEYLDDLSTYGLAGELATLIQRANITDDLLTRWEKEKQEQIEGWEPAK